jgi:hypothetical protein
MTNKRWNAVLQYMEKHPEALMDAIPALQFRNPNFTYPVKPLHEKSKLSKSIVEGTKFRHISNFQD